MNHEPFWLSSWIDRYQIRDVSDVVRTLSDRSALRDLRNAASTSIEGGQSVRGQSVRSDDEYSILAGKDIDLSGILGCNDFSCRRQRVDDLFSRVWSYFDKIVVADFASHQIAHHWPDELAQLEPFEFDGLITRFMDDINILLYLRELELESNLVFMNKSPYCIQHIEEHAREAGLSTCLEKVRELAELVAKNGRFRQGRNNSEIFVKVDHELFEHSQWVPIFCDDIDVNSLDSRYELSYEIMNRYLANLTTDIVDARAAQLPLGSTILVHQHLLDPPASMVSPANVAFQLKLPVILGVSPKELIAIRSSEREHFERFQASLISYIRQAMKESGSSDPGTVARRLQREMIEPEIAKIGDALKSASWVIEKRAKVGVALGVLTTTCGWIGGLGESAAIAAGIGVAATSFGTGVGKLAEIQGEVSQKDMYFLWKVKEYARSSSEI